MSLDKKAGVTMNSSLKNIYPGQTKPPKRIIKRDLREMDFDIKRLQRTLTTIRRQHKEFSREKQTQLETQIIRHLIHKQAGAPYPSVLQLQDAIEHSLWTNAYFKSAQYIISHRAERRIIRQHHHRLKLLIQAMKQAITEIPVIPTTLIESHENWQALCLSLFEQILNQVLNIDSESLELSEDLKHSLKQIPADILVELLKNVEDKIRA